MTFNGKGLAAVAVVLAGTAASAFAGTVNASATGDIGAPPATVGGFTMTAFGDDTRDEGEEVSDVDSPLGGVVAFTPLVTHYGVGTTWATWSHGYTGDVYYAAPNVAFDPPEQFSSGAVTTTAITLTLPAGTTAFYLYAEPNSFSVFNITGFATDGSTFDLESSAVDGVGGAQRFEFWMSGGGFLSSITMSTDDEAGFAIGEFGIADGVEINPTALVPLPTSALSGLALLGALGAIRRRRKSK